MSNEQKIWIDRLNSLKIKHDVKVGQTFRYNNKDFDVTYECVSIEDVFVTKGKIRKMDYQLYIFAPTPATYEFKGVTYPYHTLKMKYEQVCDYLWRQILIRL